MSNRQVTTSTCYAVFLSQLRYDLQEENQMHSSVSLTIDCVDTDCKELGWPLTRDVEMRVLARDTEAKNVEKNSVHLIFICSSYAQKPYQLLKPAKNNNNPKCYNNNNDN